MEASLHLIRVLGWSWGQIFVVEGLFLCVLMIAYAYWYITKPK